MESLDASPIKKPESVPVIAGNGAALLSLAEVGLGSVLHGLRLPLSGHFLSLNQGVLLLRSVRKARGLRGARTLPLTISNVSALLKSLSPAGKKLTPMLAISAQGFLMSLGLILGGQGFFGYSLGMILLCVWAFIQPLLLYYLLYGQTLLNVAHFYISKLEELTAVGVDELIYVLLAMALVKCLLGIGLVWLGFFRKSASNPVEAVQDGLLERGRQLLQKTTPNSAPAKNPIRLAFRDLFRPFFLVSLALTFLFFFFAEASTSQTIWALLRPISIGLILFYLVRISPLDQWLAVLRQAKPHSVFIQALEKAVQQLRPTKPDSEVSP